MPCYSICQDKNSSSSQALGLWPENIGFKLRSNTNKPFEYQSRSKQQAQHHTSQTPNKKSTCLHALAALTPPLKAAQALAPAARTSTDNLIASLHIISHISNLFTASHR
ncbi:hypothetical protein EYC80_005733 [Monilinia laxa]|uniref:Uncharacterized protein n=1 Tax=Monilinia laxa TaxID=61186 RepID=A0A5N6KF46_MONLA|nr:hypothetical protein EYC80_005733 [Monilinia laxa]